jgi:glycosyltransferase involved in cell wall biosynthesis
LKILQVLNHFLPQQSAGTEIYTWALSKALQAGNVQVVVVIPNYGSEESVDYSYDNIPVHQFAEPSIVDRALIMGKTVSKGVQSFRAYLENSRPDIIHFHELAGSNGISLHHVMAAKETGAKVVITFHLASYTCKTGTLMYKQKTLCDGRIKSLRCADCYNQKTQQSSLFAALNPVRKMLYALNIDSTNLNNKIGTALGTPFLIDQLKNNFKRLISLCDKVVVLTKWYNDVLVLNGVAAEKISCIEQGLPLEQANAIEATRSEVTFPIRLIFLGRISPFKGLHLLLEALLQLPVDKVSLHICGQQADLEYESLWRNKTKDFSNIQWMGKLTQQEVIPVMQRSDVLCLCSTFSEMSPLVIQEAFSAGIPVLASNVYGNAEQIKDGVNGWLFTFNDTTDLKHKIQHLIDDPQRIIEAAAQVRPPKSFKKVASAYLDLYTEILSD